EIHQFSYQLGTIPAGQTLYIRLFTKVGGVWRYKDSTFSAVPMAAEILQPVAGARGVTARTPFTWNAIPNADGYFLYVGTTPGAQDVVSSGTITTTSFKAQYLQPYSTLYARL